MPANVQATITQYAADQGYAYDGDRQTAMDPGTVCSLVYLQADGSWLVTFSTVNGDGTVSGAIDQLAVLPAAAPARAAAAPPPPPAAVPLAAPLSAPPAATGIAGPIRVSAALSAGTCSGGTVRISATVTDANRNGIGGAAASGYVQYRTTGHGFGFLPTNRAGTTSTSVNTGRPRGGYTVVWTVTATASGSSATTTATCVAP